MHDDAADIKREADRIQLIFSMLVSPVQGERVAAREALERVFSTSGRHPSDFRVVPATDRSAFDYAERMPKMHDEEVASFQERQDSADALLKKVQQERDQLLRENHALRERLDTKPTDDGLSVDLETPLHGMADDEVLNLSLDEISKRIEALMERRTTAGHNVCAQIDLPLGELGLALLHNHTRQFGKRKRRGSNAPSKSDWLKMHAGKDSSWVRKCIRAVIAVRSGGLDLRDAHSVEEILRVQRQARTSS